MKISNKILIVVIIVIGLYAVFLVASDLNTIYYEIATPQGVGSLANQEDGSVVLANEHDQGFMVNQAIIDFWRSCNGKRKVTELVDLFAQRTGLQRNQVEKEVMQLIKQLHDGGLLVITNEHEEPNVDFKKQN